MVICFAESFINLDLLYPASHLKVLVSLRKPKLIRLLGSDEHWYGWLVKGGEDLRQDSNIQRLIGFANYAITSAATINTTTAVVPLRTYAVVPVSTACGLIQWLGETTTLFAFCMNAMTVQEAESFV